jgi:phosphatidate cytidylyltransferase
MDANLTRRIGFAAVAIPLALLVVWFGGWPLALLVAVVGALGVGEFVDLAAHQGVRAFRRTGMIGAALLALLIYAVLSEPDVARWTHTWAPALAAVAVLLLLALALLRRAPDQRPLGAVAVTGFGWAYAGALPCFLLAIRHGEWPLRSAAGAALVFFPLVVTWVCDTAAMFGGRAFGGAKLAPTISPGKTRAGGIAGVIGGVLVAPLFGLWIFPAVGVALTLPAALGMALVLAVVGQAGDLAESLFKRDAGVKDSSALIPGHGGVLDRFDSLYVVLPVAFVCYRLVALA